MSLNLDKSTWNRVRLGDVVRRSRKQVDPFEAGIERYVAGGHIDGDSIHIDRWGDPEDGQMGSTFRYVFEPGQVLFVSARPYLRKSGVVDFSGVVADKTYVLDAIPENGLLQEFLPFVLASGPFIEYATAEATGSMNPRLLWGPFQRFEVDLPPLDEQRRIAELLWAAQRDSQSRAASLASVDRVIDLWMRDAGQVDGAEQVVLSDLVEHSIGGVWGTDTGASELDVAVIRGTDISMGGEIQFATAPTRSIRLAEARSRTLRSGDVLVEKSGGSPDQPVGKVGLVREIAGDMVHSNFVLLVRPDRSRCEPTFLFSLLRGMWCHGGFAEFTGKTTNIANLRTKELLASIVRVPSREIQRRLATELDALERLRTASSSALRASASLKTSLIAEVFGGN